MGSTLGPHLVQQGVHARNSGIVGQARALALDGFLHLDAEPAVVAVSLLLRLELGDAGVQGGGCGGHMRFPFLGRFRKRKSLLSASSGSIFASMHAITLAWLQKPLSVI